MVDFDKLKSEIRFKIRANRRQEISGTVLQIQLIDLVDAIETSVNKLAEDLSLNQEQVNQALTTIVQSLTTQIEDVNSAVAAEATNRRAGDEQITKDLAKKVNAEEGKGLSSNDFTDPEKRKLAQLQNYDDSGLTKAIQDEAKIRQTEDAKLLQKIQTETSERKSETSEMAAKILVMQAEIEALKRAIEDIDKPDVTSNVLGTAKVGYAVLS